MNKNKLTLFISLLILFSIIIFINHLITLVKPSILGFSIRSYNDDAIFYFKDNKTSCLFDGTVYINNKKMGLTNDGSFEINRNVYPELFNNDLNIKLNGVSGYCFNKDFDLPYEISWNLSKPDDFDYKSFVLESNENLRVPQNIHVMQGFIRPAETREYLKNLDLNINNSKEKNADIIADYNMRYRSDNLQFSKEEYFQKPIETLASGHGDCEDWALLTLSMIKQYDSNLKCYDLLLSSHMSIFCYIGTDYIIYDQNNEKHRISLRSDYSEIENKQLVRGFIQDYFEAYGLKVNERKVIAAFNEKYLIEFKNNDDFVDWLLSF